MAGNVERARRTDGSSGRAWRVARGALAPCLVLASVLASPAGLLAQPVVQALPGGDTQSLNAALARLARDPRDLSALIDAGNAALQMGDVDAATGFFARADQLSPNNMRVKAGLAAALVRSENPYDAIPLFAEAEKAGALDPMLESDRGLAYDLVGDTASAQRFYRQSIAQRPSDETLRRLALSQAIAGDRAGMELTLSPLLQRQDKGAWRTRAFALAILNRPEEAVAIANQTMPTDLAGGIAPYLRYMPKLTRAQQAAAANFGRFPRAAEIGRDDPRVALHAPPKRVAAADAALLPAGEPLGKASARASASRVANARVAAAANPTIRSAPPEIMPDRHVSAAPQLALAEPPAPRLAVAPLPAPAQAPIAARPSPPASPPVGVRVPVFSPVSPATAATAATPVATPAAAAAVPAPGGAVPRPAAAPGFDLARVTAAQGAVSTSAVAPVPAAPRPMAAPAPAPRPAAAAAPVRPVRVADAFGDFKVASGPTVPAPGAVDVRKIAAAKPKPPEPPKALPKPVHPSRIWVQVGTGRDVRALAFTWKDLGREEPELFRGKSAWISDWGRTNRLLTGPFASESAARTFLDRLKKAELDAFVWTSPAGQVVDDLPGA